MMINLESKEAAFVSSPLSVGPRYQAGYDEMVKDGPPGISWVLVQFLHDDEMVGEGLEKLDMST